MLLLKNISEAIQIDVNIILAKLQTSNTKHYSFLVGLMNPDRNSRNTGFKIKPFGFHLKTICLMI
jgi:hypothetical protein